MSSQQIEQRVIELIHQEPFRPFTVELKDGQVIEVPHPRLAINGGGAAFFGQDGGLVDFEFASVTSIRLDKAASVA